jgi:uncharacterized membrane protein YfcA
VTLSLAAIVALGAAVGGFIQGLSGFAFGLVALAIWAWGVEPRISGPLVVFGSLVGQLLALGAARRGFDLPRLLPFIVGGVAGIPIGVLLLHHIDPTGFKLAVGLILLVWCPFMLLARALPTIRAGGRWADGGAGWVGGVMGGLGGLNGPAPILWCALRGWGRDTQRAVIQSYSLVIQAVTMGTYVATGTIQAETLWLFAIVAPSMLVPTLLGARLYHRFSDAGFRRAILILLALSGVVLVSSSLLRLL